MATESSSKPNGINMWIIMGVVLIIPALFVWIAFILELFDIKSLYEISIIIPPTVMGITILIFPVGALIAGLIGLKQTRGKSQKNEILSSIIIASSSVHLLVAIPIWLLNTLYPS
ncbi:MAG: hypothetical protein L0Z48_08620 [candidate division Zixibacteria bacterium]|nr:hypothetical protein [candidate division Zixibacteria bacterium]